MLTGKEETYYVLGVDGSVLKSEKIGLNQTTLSINISDLVPGVYFIRFQTFGNLVLRFVKTQ